MSQNLVIVARIEAQPEQRDHVHTELMKLIEPTRAESGCLQYDLHRDTHRPEVFLFCERWESRAHWQAHMESAHVQRHQRATSGALVKADIWELAHIG